MLFDCGAVMCIVFCLFHTMTSDDAFWCSITIPHKMAGLECSEEVDPIAKVCVINSQSWEGWLIWITKNELTRTQEQK